MATLEKHIQESYTCELCKRKVNKESVVWDRAFVLCTKCYQYLYPGKRKRK